MVNIFGNYTIFTNADNDVMITVLEKEGEPKDPCILYDGGEHAILYRTPENSIVFDYIDKDAKEIMKAVKQVLIAELPTADAEEPTRSYFAPLKLVPKMPDLDNALPSMENIENDTTKLKNLAQTLVDNGLATYTENQK